MLCEVEGKNLACFRFLIAKLLRILSYYKVYLAKDSYRNEWNTPPTLIQNLKPVEISKNHFNII